MKPKSLTEAFALAGETALITGGATGLGLAMAECLVAAGARVVLVGRRIDLLTKAADELNQVTSSISAASKTPNSPSAPSAIPLEWDINALGSLPDLLAQAEQQIGPLSILINNAGIHLKKPALDTSDTDWASVMQTHVSAAFSLAREAARGMLERRKGSILFVGSMASLMGIPSIAAYSAAKAAVMGLVRELAAEWSGQGVRVNAIVPGWIDTGMTAAVLERDPPRKAKIMSRIMMQRMGEPDDIGWAAVYLCSPAAKYVTGATMVVDGGASVSF